MKLVRSLSALALGCAAMASAPVAAQAWSNTPDISQVFVFGDSLSDGGAGIATLDAACKSAFGKAACGHHRNSVRFGQPFFQQRSYSDGPVAVEVMADLLGKPLPAAWFNPLLPKFNHPGQNYALSSSRASASGAASLVSLGSQINAWTAHQVGRPPDPKALHVILIGGNDLLAAIDGNHPDGVAAALKEVQDSINALAKRGAARFLVYKLLDLGDVPKYQAGSAELRTRATALTAQFNAGIEALAAPQGATIHRFDMQAFWQFAKQFAYQQRLDYKDACIEPAGDLFAGIKDLPGTDLVLDGKVLPACGSVSALANRLFFDDLHPSALLHQWLGQASYDFVVEQMTGRCAIQTWGRDTLAVRGEPHVRRGLPGSLYGIDNTWNGKREYFRLTNLGSDSAYWYFPTNQRDNHYWEYLGNSPDGQACGTLFRTNVNLWDARSTHDGGGVKRGDFAPASRNAVFLYHNPYRNEAEYFRFTDPYGNGTFWYFPIDGVSNEFWWTRIKDGCLRPDGCRLAVGNEKAGLPSYPVRALTRD